MKAVRVVIENASSPLTLDIPEDYTGQRLEVIILRLDETIELKHPKYDFSDLAGKLEWKGDAVKEQRKLRDE